MLKLVALSVAQLGDARLIRIFLMGAAAGLALLALAWLGLDQLLARVDPSGWPGWLERGWTAAQSWAAGPIVLALGYFLFPAIATAVMGALLDDVVDAVEAKHYPEDKARRPIGLVEGAWIGLKSGGRFLGVNLLLAPLYLILVFTAVGPVLLYLGVNAWLLGRDYVEMVIIRHQDKAGAVAFLSENGATRFQVGGLTTLAFLVPIANLAAPLFGACLATHAVHGKLGHARR
jgi:CysZ protein